MKCGIKALLITLAIATSGMSAGALAASPSAKAQAAQNQADATSQGHVKANATASTKAIEDEGTRVSINTASADDLARVMNGVGLKKHRPSSAIVKSMALSKPLTISSRCRVWAARWLSAISHT